MSDPSDPYKTGDSGTASTPTSRLAVFAAGVPAATPGKAITGNNGAIGDAGPTDRTDVGVGTATAARPDECNPVVQGMTNPPSAQSDPGSA